MIPVKRSAAEPQAAKNTPSDAFSEAEERHEVRKNKVKYIAAEVLNCFTYLFVGGAENTHSGYGLVRPSDQSVLCFDTLLSVRWLRRGANPLPDSCRSCYCVLRSLRIQNNLSL